MSGFIKEMFAVLLTSIVNTSKHTKCVSLNNQPSITQPTLINLHFTEYRHGLRYYRFAINLDRWFDVVILLMTYLIEYMFQTHFGFITFHKKL